MFGLYDELLCSESMSLFGTVCLDLVHRRPLRGPLRGLMPFSVWLVGFESDG
jgi:hypothetical protein